ncbi:MAG TPA: hypothetical protein VHZ03_40765 [Trebonia sp.]|nr:hypothetical protein [Trebonia sp.]
MHRCTAIGADLAETALGLLADWDRQRPGQPVITASRVPTGPDTALGAILVARPVTTFTISW